MTNSAASSNRIRPMALWGLVSTGLFSQRGTSDYFMSLVPFFEPFIEQHDRQILDLNSMKDYAVKHLYLPMTDDVASLFVSKMLHIGWLTIEADDGTSAVYRCRFDRTTSHDVNYSEIISTLDSILTSFSDFLELHDVPSHELSGVSIEDAFLAFMTKRLSEGGLTDTREDPELPGTDRHLEEQQIEYWIAKFISHISLHDRQLFDLFERISGVALLAEALMEARTPTTKDNYGLKGLIVFIDGPLLMDYLGFSGLQNKDNAAFVIEKLRMAGATIACFRHSCDEIRDNLLAVLGRASFERTGPTADALRKKDVTEAVLINATNNVEYYIKASGIQIVSQKVSNLKSAQKYCSDNTYLRLLQRMPAQSEAARVRDAESVTIIMRRRAAHETSFAFSTKFLLITGNAMLVRVANDILRGEGCLSSDRSIVGPALHHRVISGLLFANFGVADKKEVSRRQLLVSCAKVIALRPKVLERLRQQVAELGRPEDTTAVDALLSQPRATEVVMNLTIGRARAVSTGNIESLITAIKHTAAEEVRVEYGRKLEDQHRRLAMRTSDEIREIRDEKGREIVDLERERRDRDDRLSAFENEIQVLSNAQQDLVERHRELEQGAQLAAIRVAERAIVTVSIIEHVTIIGASLLLFSIFTAPFFLGGGVASQMVGAIGALISAVAAMYLLWNKNIQWIANFFSKKAISRAHSEMTRLGLEQQLSRITIDFQNRRASSKGDE